MTTLSSIQEFLGRKRFAVVGVSRNSKDFSRTLYHELRSRGYDVVPVNPNLSDVEGVPCFASIRDVPQPVEGALLMTNAAVTEDVVKQCADAGVHQVWMYRAGGAGAVNPDAVRFCHDHGLAVIEGECPYMFLPGAALLPHGIHGFCRKLFGRYPS
jgi:uncharacterized protein